MTDQRTEIPTIRIGLTGMEPAAVVSPTTFVLEAGTRIQFVDP